MPNTKLFLVQFLIEADVTEWPDFDEAQVTEHFLKILKLRIPEPYAIDSNGFSRPFSNHNGDDLWI